MNRPGYDALWLWFGLSRASFLTLPRVLMHEMPDDWQARMEALLREMDTTFPRSPAGDAIVRRRHGSWPDWLLNYRYPQDSEIDQARGDDTMPTKTIGKGKTKTDPKTGKTKLERVHTYDASKSRKIAKSKTRKVVTPARAAARGR